MANRELKLIITKALASTAIPVVLKDGLSALQPERTRTTIGCSSVILITAYLKVSQKKKFIIKQPVAE